MINKRTLMKRASKVLNVALFAVTFVLAWALLYAREERMGVPAQTKVLLLVVTVILYTVFGKVYEAFLLDVERIHHMVYSQMLAAVITDGISIVMLWMVMGHLANLLPMLIVLAVQLAFSTVWCCVAHQWYFRTFPPKRTLVITGNPAEAQKLSQSPGFEKKFRIVDVLSTEEMLSRPQQALDGIETVFLLKTENAWAVMQQCAVKGVRVYRVPLISEIIASRSTTATLFHTPMLRMDGYNPGLTFLFQKRLMDVAFSGLALLLLSPVMLIVAAAIRLEDGGPVFYRQERLTQHGKRFFVLKFRSMRVDAESDGVARLSSGAHDSRVTKVGHVIRATRLDELPQLINILKGEMSIVGPRPERPELTEEYAKVLPEFRLRLLAKAGLTGYAQVYGKYNTTPEDKLRMDLLYILRPSILEDLRIMMATVKILFIRESTEGVAEGQITAMDNEQAQK